MEPFKAIVLDLDGTLLGPDRTITPENLDAVRRCHDRGVHLIVATARPVDSVRHLLPGWLYAVSWKICHNGAVLVDPADRFRFRMTIGNHLFHAVRDWVLRDARSRHFSWYDEGQWYTNLPLDDKMRRIYGISIQYPPPFVANPFERVPLSIEKILVPELSEFEGFHSAFGVELSIIRTKDDSLTMVMAAAVGKEKALEALLHELRLRQEDVMVFGDDTNDLALFQYLPYCVAMGDALPALKARAWRIAGAHTQPDSIAAVLWDTVLHPTSRELP